MDTSTPQSVCCVTSGRPLITNCTSVHSLRTIPYRHRHNIFSCTDIATPSWGDDLPTRRSTSGYVFYLSKGPFSWSSKKQATVALSSTEGEYMALTHAAKEAILLRRFLT